MLLSHFVVVRRPYLRFLAGGAEKSPPAALNADADAEEAVESVLVAHVVVIADGLDWAVYERALALRRAAGVGVRDRDGHGTR